MLEKGGRYGTPRKSYSGPTYEKVTLPASFQSFARTRCLQVLVRSGVSRHTIVRSCVRCCFIGIGRESRGETENSSSVLKCALAWCRGAVVRRRERCRASTSQRRRHRWSENQGHELRMRVILGNGANFSEANASETGLNPQIHNSLRYRA